ncbi:LrgB family protein [Novosphingobium album (ex Hu et al. 2023)]|uniref:LrgB family protein n=1 Tax=Novosphingobium album (ex Hu et al. 2023) TaxID=2930093 RepID=A0ABT0B6Y0_9SPHN|nr:LrgB family protein [Novosphingobium album (ex Hu et al. 2023)]MCJ2180669.1 LrgB family protein [Novosphingobium album (ex Hu et al. 2023)]
MTGLIATPLFWLTVTLGVFEAFDTLSKRSNRHPLCHPVLWSTPVLIGLLLCTGTPYATYREATFPISFLLGPAVVGLAVPIWAERARIRRLALPIALALIAGALTSIVSAVGILALFDAPRDLLASIAPRAATTPVAMAIASQLGGVPSLAAVIVLFAGVFGAMCATPLLNLLGVRDYRARGFAVGVAAHGIGSARAFQVDRSAGALASLGMALNAVMTAALLSLLAVFL